MGYQRELRREISQRIGSAMQEGMPPWTKVVCLSDEAAGYPTNAYTKKLFTGINPLLLNLAASERGYTSKWWGTYTQWRKLRLSVRPRPSSVPEGEWGTKIIHWEPVQKAVGNKIERYRQMKTLTVFNAQQVYGDGVMEYRVKLNESKNMIDVDYSGVECLVESSNANIEYGHDKPIYKRLPDDLIGMPDREKFLGNDPDYYSALIHEFCHWTEWRTGWLGTPAMGELIADIVTGLMEIELGYPHSLDQTNYNKYLDGWLAEMEKNPKYIFDAATQASRSLDFLLSFVHPRKTEVEPEGAYLE